MRSRLFSVSLALVLTATAVMTEPTSTLAAPAQDIDDGIDCGITAVEARVIWLPEGRVDQMDFRLLDSCNNLVVHSNYFYATGKSTEALQRSGGQVVSIMTCSRNPWTAPADEPANCSGRELSVTATMAGFDAGRARTANVPLSANALSDFNRQTLASQIENALKANPRPSPAGTTAGGGAPAPKEARDCPPYVISPNEPEGQPETAELVIELVSKPSPAQPRTMVFRVTNISEVWANETEVTVQTRCFGSPLKYAVDADEEIYNPINVTIENLDPGQETLVTYELKRTCDNFQVLARVTPAKNWEGVSQPFDPSNKHQAVLVDAC